MQFPGVLAQAFHVVGNAGLDGKLHQLPQAPGDGEYQRPYRHDAQRLDVDGRATGDAHRQGAPDAGEQVGRHRPYHVVQL